MAQAQKSPTFTAANYMSDMRLHVAEVNSYFYPDVMVTCSAADMASSMV